MSSKFFTAALALSALAALTVRAQEEEPAAEAADKAVEAKPAAQKPKTFSILPLLRKAEGTAEVLLPGETAWKPAEEGVFSPLGASYRVSRGGRLELAFGPECMVAIEGNASFTTKGQPLSETSRTILIGSGVIDVKLPDNLPEGAFCVSSASFVVKNMAGNSRFTQVARGDGDEVTIRCVTGILAVDGRHWSIPLMRAADEFRIRSSHDNLCTFLYGTSGDYVVKIDRGVTSATEVTDDGTTRSVAKQAFLDWHLSPKTKVRIDRMVPAIGERMSVSVMTFDAAGDLKNNFAYAENLAEVNTGELITAPKDDEAEETKKKAAEATEEAAATEEESATDAEQKSNENTETEE